MRKRLLIIGGVAAGTKAAARARRLNRELDITILTQGSEISYGGCGLPYYIGGIVKDRRNLIAYTPEEFSKKYNTTVLTRHRALKIDAPSKTVTAKNLDTDETMTFPYDTLLIATGASPIRPPLPGIRLKNIFTLRSPNDADAIIAAIQEPDVKRAVIVGGGLIGLEMVENLLGLGMEVAVVELMNQILPPFDEDFAFLVEKHLREQGAEVYTSDGVKAFDTTDGERVGLVITEHNKIPVDIVILSVGVKPAVDFAETGGVELGETGAIRVDRTMRTNIPDTFAAGDCVESYHHVTGKNVHAPLGSVANRQGRVAGTNIALDANDEFTGVAGSVIAKVCEHGVAKTGINEKEAHKADIRVIRTILTQKVLAGYYPGATPIWMKVLAERDSHRLVGAQMIGEKGVDKRIDVMATALTAGLKLEDLIDLDVTYSPPFSPALDPLNTAGQVLENVASNHLERLSVMEVQKLREEQSERIQLLDIRAPVQRNKTGSIPGAIHIPLKELKNRASQELSTDKKIIAFDDDGRMAPKACEILSSVGDFECAAMDGGVMLWLYGLE